MNTSNTNAHRFQNGIQASVVLANGGGKNGFLKIDPDGRIWIPDGVEPSRFHLQIHVPEKMKAVVVMKDVSQNGGGYHREGIRSMKQNLPGYRSYELHKPIEVVRKGGRVWTNWHGKFSNRVDCFSLDRNGNLCLFQVGIVTHDDGEIFRLVGIDLWRGSLVRDKAGELVALPQYPSYGAFLETRMPILNDRIFLQFIQQARLQNWDGDQDLIEPPLPEITKRNIGVVEWYIPFAGQHGQGIVQISGRDGNTGAWLMGDELNISPNGQGVKTITRGTMVRFERLQGMGSKGSPPKLINVKVVESV